jgi:hypothetical protein
MTDKMIEVFDAWYFGMFPLERAMIEAGSSSSARNRGLYLRCWQASRESMVIELPKPYAVVGDYAACGGGRSVWDVEYAEKITDRMCEKTAVYDVASLEAAGLKVKTAA